MPRLVESSDDAVGEAAARLRGGQVVVFPTETVYGLGADTFNATALGRVFALKGRALDNPLIAHVLDDDQARAVAEGWDDRCAELAGRFWPGPLTLVLPRRARVPERATAGWPTIAVRAPAHPVARALLAAFGGPVSAPSANRSGRVSPTTARHVAEDFADVEDLLVLDGGACGVGIESTAGDIALQAASPGTSLRHYAPRAPTELVEAPDLARRLSGQREPVVVLCFDRRAVTAPHRAIVMPGGAEAYAARLYDALREADALHPARILVERPPSRGGMWLAIGDRLRRAAAGP
jgi:L-threonylcarbamoyladenylate synthase